MRVSILVTSFIVSLLFVMAIGKSSLAQPNGNGPNCEELLVRGSNDDCWGGKVLKCEYECDAIKGYMDNDPVEEEWELEFYAGTFGLTAQIDRPETGEDDVLGCQCKATGSFTNPKFDTSNSYHCVGELEPGHSQGDRNDFSMEAQVVANGNTILNGEAVSSFSRSWVFQCYSNGSCECEYPND